MLKKLSPTRETLIFALTLAREFWSISVMSLLVTSMLPSRIFCWTICMVNTRDTEVDLEYDKSRGIPDLICPQEIGVAIRPFGDSARCVRH